MVPRRGLEPPRPCERQHLKLVRLPIPPPGHRSKEISSVGRAIWRRRARLSMRFATGKGSGHVRQATRPGDGLRRRRIHRPLCLRNPVQDGHPGPRRRAPSAPRLLPAAARRRRPARPHRRRHHPARIGRPRGRGRQRRHQFGRNPEGRFRGLAGRGRGNCRRGSGRARGGGPGSRQRHRRGRQQRSRATGRARAMAKPGSAPPSAKRP